MTRAQKVEIAQAMRKEGLSVNQIAAKLGVPRGTVSNWLCDPDLSRLRERKTRYAGLCADCGAPTDGSRGRGKARIRCQRCSHRHQHESAFWTREAIIVAIQEFARRYGRPPSARDWNTSQARSEFRDDLVERFYKDGCWPHYSTVVREKTAFRSWNEAIRAAGLKPMPPGHKYVDRERAA